MADVIGYILLGLCIGIIVTFLLRGGRRSGGPEPKLTWRGKDKGWQWSDKK